MTSFAKEKIERLEIDLTGTCNARCPLCARNYKHIEVKQNQRHLNEITAQLDEFINLKNIHLVGAVSEPTLYKHFFDLCRYLIKRDIEIEICTNGDTHDPNWWYELGEILTAKDSVYFSVCGSTQELHETYRVGCSLENLLNNARAFRKASDNKNDYIQHIEFDYNKADKDSDAMKKIMAEFNHINLTWTYFTRDKSIYRNHFNLDKLLVSRDLQKEYNSLNKLADKKWNERHTKNHEIECKSIFEKSVHIDQFGRIYPCYIWLEESHITDWNQNYDDIVNLTYECCKHCDKSVKKLGTIWGCELL